MSAKILISFVLVSASALADQAPDAYCNEQVEVAMVKLFKSTYALHPETDDFNIKTYKIGRASDFYPLKDPKAALYSVSLGGTEFDSQKNTPYRVNAQYLVRVDEVCKVNSIFTIDHQSSRDGRAVPLRALPQR